MSLTFTRNPLIEFMCHKSLKVMNQAVTLIGARRKDVLKTLMPLACVALMPILSFAQATLTDDHSNNGPKAVDLYLGNTGGASATVFLKFNLSGVPAESKVSQARLKLFVNPNSPGNPNQGGQYQIDVRDIGNTWSEQNASPQTNGTLLTTESISLSSYSNFITIDISDLVRDWVNGTRPNNGVALGIRSGPKNYLSLDSKENTLASQAPELVLVLDKITGVTATAGLSGGGTTGNVTVGISDGGVNTTKLADGSVTAQKIAPGAVGTPQLGLGSVTSANIAGGAVGTPQLTSGAVTSVNIATGAVGSGQLAGGAVNTAHIADSAVIANQIASGQVVKSLNGLADTVNLVAGENVTISPSGNTLTISAAGSQPPKITTKQIALLHWYDANVASDHISVGADPVNLAFDGSHIWVTNRSSNTFSKVRTSDGAVVGTFATGANPWGIAFDGSNIWVANSSANTVTKLRASDGTTVGTYPVGTGLLVGVAFDGKNIWVVINGESRVAKLNTDGTVAAKYPVGLFPYGVACDGSNIWVANAGNGNVTKIRASDGAFQGAFNAGVDANGLAFDGTYMWVSNFTSGNVTKLRASDGENLGNVAVGSGASGVAFDGTYVWVNAFNAASVTKIRASDKQVIGTYPVGVGPAGLAFDGANIWVANSLSQTLIKR
jgi:hypothetical protein